MSNLRLSNNELGIINHKNSSAKNVQIYLPFTQSIWAGNAFQPHFGGLTPTAPCSTRPILFGSFKIFLSFTKLSKPTLTWFSFTHFISTYMATAFLILMFTISTSSCLSNRQQKRAPIVANQICQIEILHSRHFFRLAPTHSEEEEEDEFRSKYFYYL